MKWTGLNEIREQFLAFFESKNHLRMKSAPLVPQEDASLLLINSGMAPLKKYFLGLETPPNRRVTTCQKCIRTPDIERVGKTSRHGTFFEMLGNFSFGDYFKEDATTWAWEFITEVMEIPVDKLWVSIYEEDEEAFEIWTKNRGVDPSRIVRLGKADNFWEIGSGPCGPCSEIYFDRGEEFGCDSPDCAVGCDCDRYVEFWNLVFTQFNSDGEGTYTPLEHPNIDTGMGLERLACIMQGVGNLFEVDTVQNIMGHIARIAGVEYKKDEKTDISLRVATDHIRSTVFMVGDGVVPQNEGRGYVLRRLLRRAARHGRLMGITEPFLYKVCDTVIKENATAYPELTENADYIRKVIQVEEERFSRTIEQGMAMLSGLIERVEAAEIKRQERILSGNDAFRLYDTFGFPLDLTIEIARDHGITVDESGFLSFMKEQRERARKAREEQSGASWDEDVLADEVVDDHFVGYGTLRTNTVILSIIKDGALVQSVSEGERAHLVVEETPFYAESGGQVGDTGVITIAGGEFEVTDCKKSPTGHYLHIGVVKSGTFTVGGGVGVSVDENRRRAIMRNHTATHLLQAALRRVIGDHVHQAGSMVDENLCRFDFTHFSATTLEQLEQAETWVNKQILKGLPITIGEMNLDEAKKMGATALFGDKYGDIVRVVNIEGESVELCGGTHAANTSQLGLFKIVSESSVAAGVRRIEGVTGSGVLRYIAEQQKTIRDTCEALKATGPADMSARASSIVASVKSLQKEKDDLLAKIAEQQTGSLADNMIDLGKVKLVTAVIGGDIEPLRGRADQMRDKYPDVVGLFVAKGAEKVSLLVFAGKDAISKGIHCGKLVKEIASTGGGSGGGRPDNAMGALPNAGGIDAAVASAEGHVKSQLGL